MFKNLSIYTLLTASMMLGQLQVSNAQCGFLNKQENGNTYYPRTTNQTVGIGNAAFLRFEVKNTANYIWDNCGFTGYNSQLSGYQSTSTGTANWFNDDFCSGVGGANTSSSSQYLGTNGWPSTFSGTEYVQINRFNCQNWGAGFGSSTINYRCVAPTTLSQGTAGNGTWNVYCYDAGDAAGGNGAWTNNYSGYYTENNLNFDTQTRWGSTATPYDANASSGNAYLGCYILPDNHSWRAVRTNISCGVYQIQVTHDDIGQIYVNGNLWYNNASCCASTNAGTIVIHPSDVIEYRVSEGGGGSNGLITFNNAATALNGGSISYGGATQACASYDPPAFGNSADASGGASAAITNGSSSYQWQLNGSDIGGATSATYDPAALSAGTYTYRRKVTDRCGNEAFSNTFTITVTNPASLPTLNTKTPNVTDICLGTTVNATINAGTNGGPGASDTYEFSTDGGSTWNPYTSGANINTASATVSVQVRVSRSGGTGTNCPTAGPSVIATWNVNLPPTAVTVSASGTYCATTTLTASGGTGGTIYFQGTTSGGTSTATPSTSQVVTSSGTYYFRAQSAAGCWGPEGSATITIQTPVTYYADVDNDGFGDPSSTTLACSLPVGYVSNNTDCDDNNNTVYPGAPEICDGLDNNCNGSVDEGVLNTYYADTDNDGFGDPANTTQACSQPVGYVTNNTDCDDSNNTIYPGATEICGNGIDEDCDGFDGICSSLVWTGLVSTDWNNPANWLPTSVPNNCATDVTIPLVPNQPSITAANYNVGNIFASNGVIITVQNGFMLNVCGDANISGATGLDIDGTVNFVGTSAQSIVGNLHANSLLLNNSTGLSIVSGQTYIQTAVSLQTGTLTTNGSLTLLSDATGTAYLDDFTGTGSVSGTIHVQRFNPLGIAGYRQLGTPVQLASIANVTGFTPSGVPGFVIPLPTCDPNYVAYNSPYGNWMQLVENGTVQYNCSQSLFEILTSGGMTNARGYYMGVNGNSTLTFTGLPNTGPVSFGLTHANNAVTNGWNMVSNPYPSPLAWEVANVPAGIDGIGKIWVTSGTYAGTFQDVDPNIPGTAIAIGQAFQVRVSVPGASVPFSVDNSDRTTSAPTYLFAGGPGVALHIDITGNGFADIAKIRFVDNATPAMDAMFDSPKMLGNANQPMVYSVWNGENYSTNSFAALDEVYAIPVGIKIATAGQHSFAFSNIDQFPASALIYLEDTQLGIMQDLRQNDTYVFTQNAGVNETRFILHFYPPVAQNSIDATCDELGEVTLTEEAPGYWDYVLTSPSSQSVSQGVLNGSTTINGLEANTYTLTLTESTSGYVAVETVEITGATQVAANVAASVVSAEIGQEIQFQANSTGANSWHWDFGDLMSATDENPNHFYNASGDYTVTLVAENGSCETNSSIDIHVYNTASITENTWDGLKLWNQNELVFIQTDSKWNGNTQVILYDIQGRKIMQKQLANIEGTIQLDCGVLAAGTYTLELINPEKGRFAQKMTMGVK